MADSDKPKKGSGPRGADPNFQYEELDASSRLQQAQARARGLEEQHYSKRLDLMTVDADQVDAVAADVDSLEAKILTLRQEESSVQSEVDANAAQQQQSANPPEAPPA